MKPPSFLKVSKWLSSILLFLIVFTLANIWSTRHHPDGLAPAFTAADLNGKEHSFDFKNEGANKPILLHFFATWCPICELENGTLNSLSEDQHLIIIAMQSGDASVVKQYQQKHGLKMTLYNDESGDISKLFKVNGVPTSFIINSQGNITSSTIGYASELGLRFRLWLSQF